MDGITRITTALERRLDDHDDKIIGMVRGAVQDVLRELKYTSVTDEELTWMRSAMEEQAQRVKLRRAVIEKSLGGLVWAFLAGAGYILLEYLRSRGVKL